MVSSWQRLTVYRQGDGLTFWAGQGAEPVELELSPGWHKGLSQFGKTMLLGPGPLEALDIADALTRGVARIVSRASV